MVTLKKIEAARKDPSVKFPQFEQLARSWGPSRGLPEHPSNRQFMRYIERLEEQVKPSVWTTEKPSRPGMWWWRSSDKQSQWIEEIDLRDGRLASIGTAGHVFIDGEYGGEWSSKSITEPEEAS